MLDTSTRGAENRRKRSRLQLSQSSEYSTRNRSFSDRCEASDGLLEPRRPFLNATQHIHQLLSTAIVIKASKNAYSRQQAVTPTKPQSYTGEIVLLQGGRSAETHKTAHRLDTGLKHIHMQLHTIVPPFITSRLLEWTRRQF